MIEWQMTDRIIQNLDAKIDKLYLALFGKPKTHAEWANSFNIKGKIKRILIN